MNGAVCLEKLREDKPHIKGGEDKSEWGAGMVIRMEQLQEGGQGSLLMMQQYIQGL